MNAHSFKEIRSWTGLSQDALAKKMGISLRTIQNWESEHHNLNNLNQTHSQILATQVFKTGNDLYIQPFIDGHDFTYALKANEQYPKLFAQLMVFRKRRQQPVIRDLNTVWLDDINDGVDYEYQIKPVWKMYQDLGGFNHDFFQLLADEKWEWAPSVLPFEYIASGGSYYLIEFLARVGQKSVATWEAYEASYYAMKQSKLASEFLKEMYPLFAIFPQLIQKEFVDVAWGDAQNTFEDSMTKHYVNRLKRGY